MRVMCDTDIDWSSLSGAKTECTKLYLKEDNEGLFQCPVVLYLMITMVLLLREDEGSTCTQNTLGIFTFYIDNKLQDKRIIGQDITVKYILKKRADTTKKLHFLVQGEICEDLINWLASGGAMSSVQAKQIAPRVMKFFEILL